MMTDAELKRCLNDYECESLSQMLREVAANSKHCTSEAGGRIPTWPLHEAAERLEAIAALPPQGDGLAELRALSEKATPGPWVYYTARGVRGVVDADEMFIAETNGSPLGVTDADEHNARLIVACVNRVRAEIERRGK